MSKEDLWMKFLRGCHQCSSVYVSIFKLMVKLQFLTAYYLATGVAHFLLKVLANYFLLFLITVPVPFLFLNQLFLFIFTCFTSSSNLLSPTTLPHENFTWLPLFSNLKLKCAHSFFADIPFCLTRAIWRCSYITSSHIFGLFFHPLNTVLICVAVAPLNV